MAGMEDMNRKPSIKQLSCEQLEELMLSYGQPKFRSGQLVEWLYKKGVSSFNEMTNLSKALRQQLADDFDLDAPTIVDKQISHDGTRKYLLDFHGSLVETVGIPSLDNRLTVCFSTQVGCAMGCIFCATGYEGFHGNLFPGNIIDQILVVQNDFNQRVTNLVGMGQGEPFLNYDNVLEALSIINSKRSLNIGARKITLSTCGIIAGINRFSELNEQYTLAVSLHAARQEVRDRIMPGVRTNPLSQLHSSLERYIQRTNRRVTFEYALISGINDSNEDLQALLRFCKGLLCHVNLIPLNSVEESPFKPTSQSTLDLWQQTISAHGIETTIRHSKGSDIDGACGQLKNARIN